jgi:membrane-associated phospholipid phosphatase
MVIAVIVVALLAARRRRRAGVALLLGFAGAMLLASMLRTTVFEPYGGYPSGHALRISYVAAALPYVVSRRSVHVGAWLLLVLVSVAAVYSTGHYSEEIIGGVLLGWAFATGARALASAPPRPSVEQTNGHDPSRERASIRRSRLPETTVSRRVLGRRAGGW